MIPQSLAKQIVKKICYKCRANNKCSVKVCRICKSSKLRYTKNIAGIFSSA